MFRASPTVWGGQCSSVGPCLFKCINVHLRAMRHGLRTTIFSDARIRPEAGQLLSCYGNFPDAQLLYPTKGSQSPPHTEVKQTNPCQPLEYHAARAGLKKKTSRPCRVCRKVFPVSTSCLGKGVAPSSAPSECHAGVALRASDMTLSPLGSGVGGDYSFSVVAGQVMDLSIKLAWRPALAVNSTVVRTTWENSWEHLQGLESINRGGETHQMWVASFPRQRDPVR